jgi:hypothetical protein
MKLFLFNRFDGDLLKVTVENHHHKIGYSSSLLTSHCDDQSSDKPKQEVDLSVGMERYAVS